MGFAELNMENGQLVERQTQRVVANEAEKSAPEKNG